MANPQGLDDLFWGCDCEDVIDWAERLTMAAEVRDLTPDKLFKIAKLNLRGRAKEWVQRLQPVPADWAALHTLMIQKYGNIDADDIRMKLDAIKQEPRERVQKYFERLDKLFRKGLGHSEDKCWKKTKDGKSASGAANFLEVMLDDEAATEQRLNRLCGGENAFSYTRVPRRRTPVDVTPGGIALVPEAGREGAGLNREVPVKSKILSHFIKGKIALSPMETVLMIPRLVDTGASMSVLAASAVRELGIMHLVTGNESYKTASGVVTRALGRVDEVQVKVGGVQCTMTFMVVDTDGYDVLLGLDFLMKIGAVVA
ncbi:unnamed protein product [Sphagnum compactum]